MVIIALYLKKPSFMLLIMLDFWEIMDFEKIVNSAFPILERKDGKPEFNHKNSPEGSKKGKKVPYGAELKRKIGLCFQK